MILCNKRKANARITMNFYSIYILNEFLEITTRLAADDNMTFNSCNEIRSRQV